MGAKRAKNCAASSITITVSGGGASGSTSCHPQHSHPSFPDLLSESSSGGGKSSAHHQQQQQSHSEEAAAVAGLHPHSFAKWRGANLQDPSGLDGVEQDSGFGDCTPKATLEKPLRLSLLKDQGFDLTDNGTVVVAATSVPAAAADSDALATRTARASSSPPVSPSHVSAVVSDREPQFLEVVFEKGWASRLGIQLEEDRSEGNGVKACVVKQIVPNTIASADARVRVGFKLLQVNDFDLRGRDAKYVIDLLRKMRGKICMKFLVQ